MAYATECLVGVVEEDDSVRVLPLEHDGVRTQLLIVILDGIPECPSAEEERRRVGWGHGHEEEVTSWVRREWGISSRSQRGQAEGADTYPQHHRAFLADSSTL